MDKSGTRVRLDCCETTDRTVSVLSGVAAGASKPSQTHPDRVHFKHEGLVSSHFMRLCLE